MWEKKERKKMWEKKERKKERKIVLKDIMK